MVSVNCRYTVECRIKNALQNNSTKNGHPTILYKYQFYSSVIISKQVELQLDVISGLNKQV